MLKNPTEWYRREGAKIVGLISIVMGICAAILLFPTLPLYALILFALIGGPGFFIAYKRKRVSPFALAGFLATMLLYFFGLAFSGIWSKTGFSFIASFAIRVVPWLVLGTFVLVGIGDLLMNKGSKPLGSRLAELSKKLSSWLVPCLFISLFVSGFVFLGMMDYNVRGDMSPPEVIPMRVVENFWVDEDFEWLLKVEAPDRGLNFVINVGSRFWEDHDIGSVVDVTVHKGALGYPWVERYA